jgi:hypothetical protein
MMGMQKFHTNGKFNLYVITAYHICSQPPVMSTMTTAWHQQKQALLKKGYHNGPCDQFISNFTASLNKLKDNKYITMMTPSNHLHS